MTRARLRAAATLFLVLAATPALAIGPPIQLARPPFTPFTGRPLVITDFDGVNGPDLAGVGATGVVVSLRKTDGSFAPQQTIAMPGSTLAAVDLDGDGRPDLITVSPTGFTTRRNLGGMVFAAASSIPTSSSAVGLAVGDLNGDGRPDAVTALLDVSSIAMSLNNGAGNLQPAILLPLPTDLELASGMSFLAIGDFTGDGKNDVVGVTRACVGCSIVPDCCTVEVFPGHGDGTFDLPQVTDFLAACRLSIASADLDGDGRLDLVLYCSNDVCFLRNHGDGTFDPPVGLGLQAGIDYGFYYGLPEGRQLAVGDLDHDGHPDIVAPADMHGGWNQRDMLAVLINRGDGTFYPPTYDHVGRLPLDAALADLDGDGWLDAVVTTADSTEASISQTTNVRDAFYLRNTHYGTFDAHLEVLDNVWIPVHRPVGPADLVGSASGRLTRVRNRGHGTFLPIEDLGRGIPWRTADLDGDGDDELLVTSNDSLWVRHALGGGAFGPPSSVQTGLTPRAIGDVTGDGKPDLVAINAALGVQVLAGDGHGGLATPTDGGLTLGEFPNDRNLAAVDLDGDGRADLLYCPTSATRLSSFPLIYSISLFVSRNDGSGHFGPLAAYPVQITCPAGFTGDLVQMAIGDFDGDYVSDVLVMVVTGGDNFGWWVTWKGLGRGSFVVWTTSSSISSTGRGPLSIAAADLNGDGIADFVRTNGNGGLTMTANTFTANGDGTFVATGSGNMQELPTDVVLADMDGDGKLDVVTRSGRTNNASIRRNVTAFDLPTPTLVSLASADFVDGAAVLDWYAAGGAPSEVSIERRTDASGWSLLAPLATSSDGYLHYVDAALPSVARVGYRLRWSDADGPHVTAETWLALPSAEFTLSGARPNPSRSTPSFAIELPRSGAIDVEVFDVGGRRVAHEWRRGLAPGRQRVTLAATLGPGVYTARIAFAGRRLDTRFVVLQ